MESGDSIQKEEISAIDDDFYASEGYSKRDFDIQSCNENEEIKQKFDKCASFEDEEAVETSNFDSSEVQLRNDVLSRNYAFEIEESKLEIETLQFQPKMESYDYVPKEESSMDDKYSSSEHEVPVKISEESNFGLGEVQLKNETLEFELKMELDDCTLKEDISVNGVNDNFDDSYAAEEYLDTQSCNDNERIKRNFNKCSCLEHKVPRETSKNNNFTLSLTKISTELMASRKNAQIIVMKEGFRCGFCPFQNQFEAEVIEHAKNYHYSKFSRLNANETVHENCNENLKNNLKSHFCKTKEKYKKTQLMVHSDQCKLYKCTHCDFRTKDKSHLKTHLMVHSGKCELYQCEHCNYKTRYKSDLKRHLIIHSDKCYLYKCAHCEFKTKSKARLKLHLMMHSDECKFYKCQHCDFKTKHKYYLKTHLTLHSDECEFYKCEHCGYKTKSKSYLKIHLMVHSDECRLFECAHCKFKTKHKSSLKMHLLVHSGEFHKCEHCDFKTKHKRYLKTHLMAHKNAF